MLRESVLPARRDAASRAGPAGRDRRALWIIAALAVLAAALRLPYVWTGLSTDEGGYAYVAQQWSRGARLYDTAWLDRPQGLLLTYRGLLALGESGWAIRGLVVLIGAVMTILIAWIGALLAGRRLAVAAAAVYAVVGVAPHLEGFTLNGELLATVPATASVAAALQWRRSRRAAWLLGAGVLAGLALAMKQSGFDGLVVGLAIVLGVAGAWRARLGWAVVFLSGFAVPIAALVVDGWRRGWSRYWNALAGYQFSSFDSAHNNAGTRWSELVGSLPFMLWDIGAVIVIAVLGLWLLPRSGRGPLVWWLAAGLVAVNLGGSYWAHYYVQVLPPLVLAASYAAVGVASRGLRVALAAILVIPALGWMVALIPLSSKVRQDAIPYFGSSVRDRHIAAAVDAETRPDQRIYVLESDALLYLFTQRPTSYRYLWGMPIKKIPSAIPSLQRMLEANQRPTLVIMGTPNANTVDPSGGIARDLARYYHADRVVGGVLILRANNAP
ncbi:MAG TPA: glycosyltransferase family 39 protein [Micromonosporaceae bacterium]|nr:glycosyltransferase family 39 protein [Micromonosporaceae bacterium]